MVIENEREEGQDEETAADVADMLSDMIGSSSNSEESSEEKSDGTNDGESEEKGESEAGEESSEAETETTTDEESEESAGEEASNESTEGDAGDEEGEEEEVSETVSAREKILLAKIEELTGTDMPPTTPVAPAAVETPELVIPEEVNFLEGFELNDILDDPETLQKVLMKVATHSATQGRVTAVEHILKSIPTIVTQQIQHQTVLRKAIKEFYTENEDLTAVKKTVGVAMNEVVQEFPNYSLEQAFGETAKRVRTSLGLKKKAGKKTVTQKVKKDLGPALPGRITRGPKPNVVKTSQLEQEIADLIDI